MYSKSEYYKLLNYRYVYNSIKSLQEMAYKLFILNGSVNLPIGNNDIFIVGKDNNLEIVFKNAPGYILEDKRIKLGNKLLCFTKAGVNGVKELLEPIVTSTDYTKLYNVILTDFIKNVDVINKPNFFKRLLGDIVEHSYDINIDKLYIKVKVGIKYSGSKKYMITLTGVSKSPWGTVNKSNVIYIEPFSQDDIKHQIKLMVRNLLIES